MEKQPKPRQLNKQQMNECAIEYARHFLDAHLKPSFNEFINRLVDQELWYWTPSQHDEMLHLASDVVVVFAKKPSDLREFWKINT